MRAMPAMTMPAAMTRTHFNLVDILSCAVGSSGRRLGRDEDQSGHDCESCNKL
jgi:hypothetical protein